MFSMELCIVVFFCFVPFNSSVRTSLIPCDANHLAKNLPIPLINQWPALETYNNQQDVKLFRRFDCVSLSVKPCHCRVAGSHPELGMLKEAQDDVIMI